MTKVFAKDRLRGFVERIERLEIERKALSDDIKEVYAEARGEGFKVKTMRECVRLRKMDKADFQEYEAELDMYKGALGMGGTPLFDAAEERQAAAVIQHRKKTKAPAPLPPHDPETGEVHEIPAGSHASGHGQPDETVEEASSAPAHDADGKGPEEAPAKHPASKPVAVVSATEPHPVKVTNDEDCYMRGIRRTA